MRSVVQPVEEIQREMVAVQVERASIVNQRFLDSVAYRVPGPDRDSFEQRAPNILAAQSQFSPLLRSKGYLSAYECVTPWSTLSLFSLPMTPVCPFLSLLHLFSCSSVAAVLATSPLSLFSFLPALKETTDRSKQARM